MGVRGPYCEKVTRTDHPACPEQRLMLRPWKPFQILFVCWVQSAGSRAVHLESRLLAGGRATQNTHWHQEESVGMVFSWRLHYSLCSLINSSNTCADLVQNNKRSLFFSSASGGQVVVLSAAGRTLTLPRSTWRNCQIANMTGSFSKGEVAALAVSTREQESLSKGSKSLQRM